MPEDTMCAVPDTDASAEGAGDGLAALEDALAAEIGEPTDNDADDAEGDDDDFDI